MQNSSKEEPLIDMLAQYASQGIVPFHMPGHKMGRAMKSFPPGWDITDIPGASNLKSTRAAIAEAEAATAKVYGTVRTFFLVQGSTLGVQTMMMSMVGEGKKVLMGRNAHQSGFNGCILS
jgi:lysine decarboxylase